MKTSGIFTALIITLSLCRVSSGQTPAGSAQAVGQIPAPVRTYTASGSLTNAAKQRLNDALRKVEGVEQIEFRAMNGIFTVRIIGAARPNAVGMAGIAAGFDFRPAPTRTFELSGPTAEADIAKLREALQKASGVEQVDTIGSGPGMSIRVQGEISVATLVSIALGAGYELKRSLIFAASGSSAEKDVSKLRGVIGKVTGVKQANVRSVGGGAHLTVAGSMDEDGLMAGARSIGYSLKPLGSNAGNNRMFSVLGVTGPEDEEKLRKAVLAVGGIGEVQVMTLGDMTRLGVRGGSADPGKIMAAALQAGFAIEPVVRGPQGGGSGGELNTPPAYDERVNEDLTKVGDIAPDFELVMKDGKGKIKLSSYRGKKPVVLIFGSYT